MEFIPLYPKPPRSAVEAAEPRDRCSDCNRCFFSGIPDLEVIRKRAKTKKLDEAEIDALVAEAEAKKPRVNTVCMPPEGKPGGLLIVTDYPTADDDKVGRPLYSKIGNYVRQRILKYWDGPVAADTAIKCAPGSLEVRETHLRECRSYLHANIKEIQPKRIITMGSVAMQAVLGRRPAMLSVRRGYGWYTGDGSMTPVFLLMSPNATRQNAFIQQWFEYDLKWACTTPIGQLIRDMPTDAFARIIRTPRDAKMAYESIQKCEWLAWDAETAGLMFNKDFKILCVSMAEKDCEDIWVWSREALLDPECFKYFKAIMIDEKIKKIPQNGKYDRLAMMAAYDIVVRGNFGDTLFWRKLLDSDADGKLDVMQELVGMGGGKAEMKSAIAEALKACRAKGIGRGKKRREVTHEDLESIGPLEHVLAIREKRGNPKAHVMALIDEEPLYRYCARDSKSTELIAKKLEPRLRKNKEIERIWDRLIQPASEAIVHIERWGVEASRDTLHFFQRQLAEKRADIESRFAQYDGQFKGGFNPASTRQVATLLFDVLGLPVLKKTPNQPCTDAATLERLKDKHPIVKDLLDYRLILKQEGTYADGMITHIRDDGRIHPTLNLAGARSGRLSCSDPNLQNITAPYTWYGKIARDIFTVPKGRVMIQLDFSQLELRVAAMISGDKKMKHIFIDGADYHQKTAEIAAPIAWGITPDKAKSMGKTEWKPYRKMAKVFNFGMLYGMGDAALAAKMGATKQEAAKIREAVLGSFHTYAAWANKQVEIAQRTGYTWTWWDGERARRRSLWRIRDADSEARSRAENGASNCLDAETEALTKRGWVKGFELKISDQILTKNPTTGFLEWQCPTDLKFYPNYNGALVEFKSKSFHAVTTPSHRWLVTNKANGRWVEKTSKTISKYGDHRIHRTGEYNETSQCQLSDDMLRLVGWWLTDGYRKKTRRIEHRPGKAGPKPGYPKLGLCQSTRANIEKVRQIEQLLVRLGINATVRDNKDTCCRYWEFKDKNAALLFDLFPTRCLTPTFVSSLSRHQAEIVLQTMMLGDGNYGDKGTFCSGIKQQAEIFQMLAVLCGYAASIVCRDMRKYTPKSEKLKNIPCGKDVWYVTLRKRTTVQVLKKHTKEYEGKVGVWCPVVPNTFFVARRSGQVYITGNTPIQGCLPYNTRVLTSIGYQKIGEIPEVGSVWTGTKWANYKRLDRGECERAQVYLDNGHIIECDTRHSVLVERGTHCEFVSFDDLKLEDQVCLSMAKQQTWGNKLLPSDEAYWMGFAIGNGCASHGKTHANALAITFGDRKGRYKHSEKASKFAQWVQNIGKTVQKPRVYADKTTVVVESKSLRSRWEGFGYCWGDTASKKRIPDTIWHSDLDTRISFITGLLDADGTVGLSKAPPSLHMCQRNLLEEVQILLRTIGVESKLRGPYQWEQHVSWRLDCNGGQLSAIGYGIRKKTCVPGAKAPSRCVNDFFKKVPKCPRDWSDSWKTLYYKTRKSLDLSAYVLAEWCSHLELELEEPLYATSTCVEKKKLGFSENTYTLSVDDDSHRFDGEGVIHKNTASDFCLASLVECVRWILETKFPAKLVLTVHDSLMFEVDIDYADELIRTVLNIMQSWPSEGVPIVVDAEIGLSWGSLFELEERDGVYHALWEEDVIEDGKKKSVKCSAPWQEKVFENS